MFRSNIRKLVKPGCESQIARRVGISRFHLWKLANKPCNPSLSVAKTLSKVLRKPIDELFEEIPEEKTGSAQTKVIHSGQEVNA